MSQERIKVSMKPISQRILPLVYSQGVITTKNLAKILSDIPQASLYRYVRELIKVGALEVVSQEQKRGGFERTIKLGSSAEGSSDEIDAALMYIKSSFNTYFEKENPDPLKDLLMISGIPLVVSDEEFLTLLNKIKTLVEAEMNKPKTKERKNREIYIISAPVEDELKRQYRFQ